MCRIIGQNIKKCVFDSLDFQNFPGEHAPGPPRKARSSPSQWSLRDHSLNHIISLVSRLQFSKSWQVCWSFIPMIMSAHVSFVIAGTVPVGDMHLFASTNQKAYAAFISRQWKNMCSTVSRHIPQRGEFRTASTNPCRDSLSLVGSTLFRSRHLKGGSVILIFEHKRPNFFVETMFKRSQEDVVHTSPSKCWPNSMRVLVCIAIGKAVFWKKFLKMAGDPHFFLRKFVQFNQFLRRS